jgi:hypothetical protein
MKIVNVPYGDYTIRSRENGVITLNTGINQGTVIITGDLTVLGTTTTVDTANMTIEDNVILLNKGESGAVITEGKSGIEIDRGSSDNPEFVFDESITSYDPGILPSGGTATGTWVFRKSPSALAPIQTRSINSNGQSLHLISTGTGYITVAGTTNYERQILSYTDTVGYNPSLGVAVIDDDRIPNIRAVSDFIQGSFTTFTPNSYGAGDTVALAEDTVGFVGTGFIGTNVLTINTVISGVIRIGQTVTGFGVTPGTIITGSVTGIGGVGTYTVNQFQTVTVTGITTGEATSQFTFKVDNTLEAYIDSNGMQVNNIRLDTNTISSSSSGLTVAPFDELFSVDGSIALIDRASDPSVLAGAAKLYTKSLIGAGNTGIYFVNSGTGNDGSTISTITDELISKRRSLVFSMIF